MLGVDGMRLIYLSIAFAASLMAVYPATPRNGAVDIYFGTRVADPYRWLEHVNASETKRWVHAQLELTDRAFAEMHDRSAMRSLVTRVMGARSDKLPQFGGSVSAFARSDGNGGLPYVVVARGRFQHIAIDPNRRWPRGGTSLADWQLAPNGRFIAYATKRGGLGLVCWHLLDLTTERDRHDIVVGTPDWAPITWAANGEGFYYGGYRDEELAPPGAPIGTGYAVRFHRIGTEQNADRLVFARADRPTWLPYAEQSTDGRYEIVGAIDGSDAGMLLAVRDLRDHSAR